MEDSDMMSTMFEKLEKGMHKNISVAVSEVAKEVNENLKNILKSVFDQIQTLEGSMWKDILEAKVILDKYPKRALVGKAQANEKTNSAYKSKAKLEVVRYDDDESADFSNEKFLDDQEKNESLLPPFELLMDVVEKTSPSTPHLQALSKRQAVERKGKYKKGYSCDMCDYETDFITALKSHIDNKHDGISSLIEEIEKQELENEKLRAEQLRNASEKKVKKTIIKEPTEYLNIEYLCKVCNHCAKDKSAFDEHQDMHEKVEALTLRVEEENVKYLQCKECNYRTTTSRMQRSNFTSHVKHVHLKIKKYFCDQCGYSAAYNNGLNQHIRHVHQKEYDYFCDLCSFGTTKKSLVGAHMRRAHKGHLAKTEKDMDYSDNQIDGISSLIEKISNDESAYSDE